MSALTIGYPNGAELYVDADETATDAEACTAIAEALSKGLIVVTTIPGRRDLLKRSYPYPPPMWQADDEKQLRSVLRVLSRDESAELVELEKKRAAAWAVACGVTV